MLKRILRLAMLPMIGVVFSASMANDAQATLVAQYNFEGGAGVNLNDLSGNGHHGTLITTGGVAVVTDPDPLRGDVLNVTGNGGGVNIHSTVPIPAFPANQSFTLSAWVKRASKTTSQLRYAVSLGAQGDAPIGTLGLNDVSNTITGYIESDLPGTNTDQVQVDGATAIENGATAYAGWHHIAIVYDRSNDQGRTYLDGFLDNIESIAAVDDTQAQTWTAAQIGRSVSANTSLLGRIDDVYIYDEVRTQSQIQTIMGGPLVNVVVTRTAGSNYGSLTLTNTGTAATTITSYKLTSASGALLSTNWIPVTGNYDSNGNGSFDDAPWLIQSPSGDRTLLAEAANSGSATIGVGQTVVLGNPWIQSYLEDVKLELRYGDGRITNYPVTFSGGPGGVAFPRSDLNFDGAVNATDWPLFYPHSLTNLSGLSAAERYQKGDLNGDGQNDLIDFTLFKSDYDIANGAGMFDAMLGGVPEPTTMALVLLGGAIVGFCRRRRPSATLAVFTFAMLGMAGTASATAVDFTTFTQEAFSPATGFPTPAWTSTTSSATLNNNADASIYYSPDSPLNKRYIGLVKAGTDDDVLGFALGFEPGDATIGSSADYMLVDWKGLTQSFNFGDLGAVVFHHDQTPVGDMPIGLALSRVTGSPTADEFWQHMDLPENTTGGVVELARGTNLGSAAYVQSASALPQTIDITYQANRVQVRVDGNLEIDVAGSFPDGRFGLYSGWMTPGPIFSNFEVFSADFTGLSVVVDRSNGNITLQNTGPVPVPFDFYQFNSASSSLNSNWNSLSDQNFQSVGGGPGQSWDEAGGSSDAAIAEFFLAGNSTLSGTPVVLGGAYDNTVDGQDLVFQYRLPNGAIMKSTPQYINAPVGVPGDYNGNGTVDAGDYVMWRKGGPLLNEVATIGSVTPEDYTEWRARFGNSGSGSGASLGGGAAVPEPNALIGALCFGLLLVMGRRAAVRVA